MKKVTRNYLEADDSKWYLRTNLRMEIEWDDIKSILEYGSLLKITEYQTDLSEVIHLNLAVKHGKHFLDADVHFAKK